MSFSQSLFTSRVGSLAEILSQSEIDALLKALSSGEIDAETVKKEEKKKSVKLMTSAGPIKLRKIRCALW